MKLTERALLAKTTFEKFRHLDPLSRRLAPVTTNEADTFWSQIDELGPENFEDFRSFACGVIVLVTKLYPRISLQPPWDEARWVINHLKRIQEDSGAILAKFVRLEDWPYATLEGGSRSALEKMNSDVTAQIQFFEDWYKPKFKQGAHLDEAQATAVASLYSFFASILGDRRFAIQELARNLFNRHKTTRIQLAANPGRLVANAAYAMGLGITITERGAVKRFKFCSKSLDVAFIKAPFAKETSRLKSAYEAFDSCVALLPTQKIHKIDPKDSCDPIERL